MKKLTLTIMASSMLAAGALASSPAFTDSADRTSISAVDDRSGFVFLVDSQDQILSTRLRVVGPDDYVYEQRSEGGDISWARESTLADGLYSWEVVTVSAPHSAPMIPPTDLMEKTIDANPQGNEAEIKTATDVEQPRLLHMVPSEYRSVTRKGGRFEVREGHIYPAQDIEAIETANVERNIFIRIADTAISRLFPTAAAQDFTSDVSIEKINPGVLFDDTGSSGNDGDDWRIRGRGLEFYVFDAETARTPFTIEKNTPNDSLYVRGVANRSRVGIGTSAPFAALHISESGGSDSAGPRIFLENTSDDVNWQIHNSNGSRFEVSQKLGFDDDGSFFVSNPFQIETPTNNTQIRNQDRALFINRSGRIGLGTDTPVRDLHIMGGQVRLEHANSTWDLNPGGAGLWFNHQDSTGTAVMKLQNNAPSNSIVVDQNGVGFGTASPQFPINLVRNDNSAQIRVTDTGEANNQAMLVLENEGGVRFRLRNSKDDSRWDMRIAGSGSDDRFQFTNFSDDSYFPMTIFKNGNVEISGTLTESSSRYVKHEIKNINPADLLSAVAQLEIPTWRYNNSPEALRIGPIAEDWFKVFGFGTDETSVSPRDIASVALATNKALLEELAETQNELELLRKRVGNLENN